MKLFILAGAALLAGPAFAQTTPTGNNQADAANAMQQPAPATVTADTSTMPTTIVFANPGNLTPPPPPKASYPRCKRGQYDGCTQYPDPK
ncbi:hypothetical protein BH09PSE4_BH09PSE4_22150 [soil metagenome]